MNFVKTSTTSSNSILRPVRCILLVVALISLTGMPYVVLVPIFAKEILHGGAHTFGFLMTAAGCGALIGTATLASRKSVLGLGRTIVRGTAILATGIASFAMSSYFPLSLISLVVAGFGAVTVIASSNTVLQTILEEDKRGRFMSFLTMSFMGIRALIPVQHQVLFLGRFANEPEVLRNLNMFQLYIGGNMLTL